MGTDLLPFSEVSSIVAGISVLGIFLLLPLYLSQRRDVQRLHDWMNANPDHPVKDLAVSERILDNAERDLAKAYADRGEPVPWTMEFEAVRAATAVKEPRGEETAAVPLEESLLTSERPALTQVTMERAALEPHPRWKHFVARVTQPRWLAVIALTALILGAGGIVVVEQVLRDGGDDGGAVLESGGIEVAVLNTTSASGIAGRVASDIEDAGFVRGEVGNIQRDTDQTIVMYAPGQKRAGNRVGRELGDVAVQPIDRQVQAAAGEADVVIILGQDRATS
jgi:hypothetical protein